MGFFNRAIRLFLRHDVQDRCRHQRRFGYTVRRVQRVIIGGRFISVLDRFLGARIFVRFEVFAVREQRRIFRARIRIRHAFRIDRDARRTRYFNLVSASTRRRRRIVQANFLGGSTVFIRMFHRSTNQGAGITRNTIFFRPQDRRNSFSQIGVRILIVSIFRTIPNTIEARQPTFDHVSVVQLPCVGRPTVEFHSRAFSLFARFSHAFGKAISRAFAYVTFRRHHDNFDKHRSAMIQEDNNIRRMNFIGNFFICIAFGISRKDLERHHRRFIDKLNFMGRFPFCATATRATFAFMGQ